MRLITSISTALLWTVIASAQPAALFYDLASGPVGFAATEIRNAHAARGLRLVEHSLDTLPSDSATLRFVIASGATASQRVSSAVGFAALKGGSPQSYSIRRSSADGRTTIAILGADAAGDVWRAGPG